MESFTASVFQSVRRQARAYQAGGGGLGRAAASTRTVRPVAAPPRPQPKGLAESSPGPALRIADSLSITPVASSLPSRLVSAPVQPVTPTIRITAQDVTLHPDARLQIAVSTDGHGRVTVLGSANGARTRYQAAPGGGGTPTTDTVRCERDNPGGCPDGEWNPRCECIPCERAHPGGCPDGDWTVTNHLCHCVTAPGDCEGRNPGGCPDGEWTVVNGRCDCVTPADCESQDPGGCQAGRWVVNSNGTCTCVGGGDGDEPDEDGHNGDDGDHGNGNGKGNGNGNGNGDDEDATDDWAGGIDLSGWLDGHQDDEADGGTWTPPETRCRCGPGFTPVVLGSGACICVGGGGPRPRPITDIEKPDDIDECEKCPEDTKALPAGTLTSSMGGLIPFLANCAGAAAMCVADGGEKPADDKLGQDECCCEAIGTKEKADGNAERHESGSLKVKKKGRNQGCVEACKEIKSRPTNASAGFSYVWVKVDSDRCISKICCIQSAQITIRDGKQIENRLTGVRKTVSVKIGQGSYDLACRKKLGEATTHEFPRNWDWEKVRYEWKFERKQIPGPRNGYDASCEGYENPLCCSLSRPDVDKWGHTVCCGDKELVNWNSTKGFKCAACLDEFGLNLDCRVQSCKVLHELCHCEFSNRTGLIDDKDCEARVKNFRLIGTLGTDDEKELRRSECEAFAAEEKCLNARKGDCPEDDVGCINAFSDELVVVKKGKEANRCDEFPQDQVADACKAAIPTLKCRKKQEE